MLLEVVCQRVYTNSMVSSIGRAGGFILNNHRRNHMDERWNAAQTRLLADVGVLFVSLNQLEAFQQVARRLVPLLGDWCAIIIRDEHQQARRVAVACADPRQQPLVDQLVQTDPLVDPASAPAQVLRSGQLVLLDDLPDEYSARPAFSPAYRAVMMQVRPRHLLCVPMRARDQVNGVGLEFHRCFGPSLYARRY